MNISKALSDTKLPQSIITMILTISRNLKIDINTVNYLGAGKWLIGEPKTKLTIVATSTSAHLVTDDIPTIPDEKTLQSRVQELETIMRDLLPFVVEVERAARNNGLLVTMEDAQNRINNARQTLGLSPQYS